MNTQEKNAIFNDDDVYDLMAELKSVICMMEPYYSQCGGANEAEQLLSRLEAKLPVTVSKMHNAQCKICGKTFERSNSKRLLTDSQQNSSLNNHLGHVHGITDFKERNRNSIRAHVQNITYANKAAADAAKESE